MALPIVVLLSGNGSNLQAIMTAIEKRECNATIQGVISNNTEAHGLVRAKKASIPTYVLEDHSFKTKSRNEKPLLDLLKRLDPKLIVLAGFMRILGPEVIQHFPRQIINIHPSLLPKYPGLNTHRRVLEAKEQEHGVTVHFVDQGLDSGPIIAYSKISVYPCDTEETLKQRIHIEEHALYPKVINDFANQFLNKS